MAWNYTATEVAPIISDRQTIAIFVNGTLVRQVHVRDLRTALAVAIDKMVALMQRLDDLGDCRGSVSPADIQSKLIGL